MRKNLLRSVGLVSSITVLSRLLGFVRDVCIAQLFGATPAIDAFYVAFRIPNLMRALFAEGAFSQAFVPVLTQYLQSDDPEAVKQFISRIQGALLLVLLSITLLAIGFAPAITGVFAPGFLHDPKHFALTVHLLRITFPYALWICMTAFYGAILNTYDRFAPPAFTPVLLNVVLITAALWGTAYFQVSVEALAWGVCIAGILQCLFLQPFLIAPKIMVYPTICIRDKGVGKVLRLLVPALLGVSLTQISLLIDTFFASFLPHGSITWLYYANRLVLFPLGIFGVALATVILPNLSRRTAELEDFSRVLDWGLRCISVIALPAGTGLYLLSVPLFATLFQYGRFHIHDAQMASFALRAYALGLPAFMGIKVLVAAYYARQNVRTPVKIVCFALVCNILLNLAFITPFKHAGLALATTCSASLNAILLLTCHIKAGHYHPKPGWLRYGLQLGLATCLMSICIVIFSPKPAIWMHEAMFWRVAHLAWLLCVGVLSYFACLYGTGVRLRHFRY